MQLLYCSTTLETAKPYNIHFILRRMKILAFIILVACLQTSATGHSQTINLSLKETRLEKVFQLIRQQSNYRFIYTKEEIAGTKPVTVQLHNATIEQAMNSCLVGQPLDWFIDENHIIIKKKEVVKPVTSLLAKLDIRGKITSTNGEALAGATITVKGSNKTVVTNEKGEFVIEGVEPGAILIISSLGHQPIEYLIKEDKNVIVQLKALVSELENIKVSTGYEELPKERATGSFEKVNNELFNRSVTTNVLERLEGIVPGLVFNRKIGTANNTDISIRGISTLNSDQKPLLIVDNFPYEGNINNINPNDVESITVLKDAAAASIWGAKAGNGVIVITTKKAGYNQKTRLTFNHNTTVISEPDLNYIPRFTSTDYVGLEKYLFSRGFYNGNLNSSSFPIVSPVVEILAKRRAGLISAEDSATQIGELATKNVLDDYRKYLYRPALNSQYAMNLSGGSGNINYLFSVGYDKNLSTLYGDDYNRFSVRSVNQLRPLKQLELSVSVLFTQTNSENNSLGTEPILSGGKQLYPYASLADAGGNALSVPKDYQLGFLDTAGQGNLLDWKYRPLDEIRLANNKSRQLDWLVNVGAKWHITAWLNAELKYQWEKTFNTTQRFFSPETYYTRNLVNLFTPRGGTTANSAIPQAGILNEYHRELNAQGIRGQLNFNKTWNGRHEISAIVGTETRELHTNSKDDQTFGYDDEVLSFAPVNYLSQFPTYFGSLANIGNPYSLTEKLDRYVSFYGNASYTFDRRYTISASGRRDASNLFGTATNNRWKPLWSAGMAWNISRESFFNLKAISLLKLRASHGYSGNVNNSTPAILTLQSTRPNNLNGFPAFSVFNPPNPSLRWENVAMTNLGLDFSFTGNRISGSLEFYTKKSTDLIAEASSDITTGYGTLTVNSAELKGKGIDVGLKSVNVEGKFNWSTDWLFSWNTNKVARYLLELFPKDYLSAPITPIEGETAYSVISYRWAGLDSLTGAPLGYLDGKASNNYRNISRSLNPSDFIIHGSARPIFFGAIRNTLNWKGFNLSFNITYRLGYYFKRPNAISYSNLYSAWAQQGYQDYKSRWQKPGDEKWTSVPAMVYPADTRSDNFYKSASVNVERGDHIRFQDINLNYTVNKAVLKKTPLQGLKIYAYVNNLGMIWKATDEKLDPDFGTPIPISYSLGINVEL